MENRFFSIYICFVIKRFETSLSIFLIAIMAMTSVGLPFSQGYENLGFHSAENESVSQDSSLDKASGLVYLLDKENTNVSVQKIDGGCSLYYILPVFSLSLIHNSQITQLLALSKKVVINLDVAKIIFPFAYFW